jgi:dipeptidyl aminopeptidase/acylaminoacyl peptidase
MRPWTALLLVVVFPAWAAAQPAQPEKRPMKVDDLFRFKRIADPQISPDGKWVVYVQGSVSLEKNKITRTLWLAPTDGGSLPKQLTSSDKSDGHPRWSPDGRSILFESSRSGSGQLWIIDVGGGEARQLTNISTEASNGIWSRDGAQIAFVSAVWPEYSEKPLAESDKLNKKRIDDRDASPVKVRVASKLFFRHWDEYVEDKRQHIFVAPFANGKLGEPRDITPGDRDAYPTSTTFSSGEDFTFSPDGKYVYFTAVPEHNEAWNTDYDVCRAPIDGRSTKWETVSFGNKAADSGPQFSPDGKWLAFRSQKKPGYEADKWEIIVMAADGSGMQKSLTSADDHSADAFVWESDSNSIVYQSDDKGSVAQFFVTLDGATGRRIHSMHSDTSVTISQSGEFLAVLRARMDMPPVVAIRKGKFDPLSKARDFENLTVVTPVNDRILKELDLPRPQSVTVKGAGGTPMQMWILKPPGFDPTKKWPLAFLVHGGPQGAWEDGWSYRWNAEAWAAQGYVVALPNPRGSTGFGQKYVDEISSDWGGKCYQDLMAGLAYLEEQPYIDTNRMAAAGASFGGYMMNWFAVNTGKFKCLITHCGVWNFDSMYALTEELWFDEWEHGGPPWGKNRDSYEKHSPHRLAANLGKFKTPMLVIHNDLDYRVAVAEGIQLFTTLQRQGVPSRFVNFPDEGHWVLKPRNSQYWYQETFGWLKKHVEPNGK